MEYLFRKLSIITNIHIVKWKRSTNDIVGYGEMGKTVNPIVVSENLRELLMYKSDREELPVIYQDENKVIFCCMKSEGSYFAFGPVCAENLTNVEIHRYYKRYGIKGVREKHPPKLSIYKIRAITELMYYEIYGEKLEVKVSPGEDECMEKQLDGLKNEEINLEDEETKYHHTYQDEVRTMNYIREGRLEEAVEAEEQLAMIAGKLSESDLRNEKNLSICSVTLSTRAAIEGGASPSKAYRLSDYYINKIDCCKNVVEVNECRKKGIYDFTKLVIDERNKRIHSNYVEQCKEYIHCYYNRKIYLSDIADELGISEGHLSKVFKRETGENIQEYIAKFRVERAANLLIYSEASLSEISDYVCFNSQSHFGSVFKKYHHMTPRQYREKYKKKEFISHNKTEL